MSVESPVSASVASLGPPEPANPDDTSKNQTKLVDTPSPRKPEAPTSAESSGIGVTLLRVSFDLVGDLAGASVGTAYSMTVNLMGASAGTAASVTTSTLGLLATLVVRAVAGDGAATVVSLASRAAAATAGTAVQTSVATVGSVMGVAVGMGTSLIIKSTGRVLIYAGSALVNRLRSTSSSTLAQNGFDVGVVDPFVSLEQTETPDGDVLITLTRQDPPLEASYEMVTPPKLDFMAPFEDDIPVGVPVTLPSQSMVLEHRTVVCAGGFCVNDQFGSEWLAAEWDPANSCYIIPVGDAIADGGELELRTRAVCDVDA